MAINLNTYGLVHLQKTTGGKWEGFHIEESPGTFSKNKCSQV